MDLSYIAIGINIVIQIVALVWFQARLLARIEKLEIKLEHMSNSWERTETSHNGLEDRVNSIEKSHIEIQGRVHRVREDITSLDKRVTELERKRRRTG